MIYYFTLIFLSVFSMYELHRLGNTKNEIGIVLCFLLILILGGLRFQVGTDWNTYNNIFRGTQTFTDVLHSQREKLFMTFLFFSKRIYNNYSFFIFSFFAISFSLKFQFIKKYSSDIFLSLIIYFFTLFIIYDINQIRQGMALAFVLLSTSAILDRKIFRFIILIFIASLFHLSAIVFIPAYWISKIRISPKTIFIVLGLSLSFSLTISAIIENSSIVQALLKTETFSHYSTYINNANFIKELSILSIGVMQRILIFLLFLFYFDNIKAKENLKYLLLNGYFISIVIFIFLSFSAELAARLSFYYKALEILIVPYIVTSQKLIQNRIILFILFFALSILAIYRLLDVHNNGLIPYNSILW
ncbi:MAG: EpsG family protein [Paludibacter sp.]|nr:EpsG family protein [Paludibacter sp.]